MNAVSISKRTGRILLHDTSINIWDESCDDDVSKTVMRSVVATMRSSGFVVRRDPDTVKHYPTLAPMHYVGILDGLEFQTQSCGRHVEVQFFQNVCNVTNPNGGRYDFDKFHRMPRAMQVRCAVLMHRVIQRVQAFGYAFDPRGLARPGEPLQLTVLRIAEGRNRHDDPLADFNERWKPDRFKRDERGWPVESEYMSGTCGRNVDRDGKHIRCGEIKYTRVHGRLFRGMVFTNMNDMWGIYAGGEADYVPCWELFDCERPDLEPRRLVPGRQGRLRKELDSAMKTEDFKRVQVLARVLSKMPKLPRCA